MKVRVDFRYFTMGTPPRCRIARRTEHSASAVFQVQTATPDEAPVAIVQENGWRDTPEEQGPVTNFVFFKKGLWKPETAGYANPTRTEPVTILPHYTLSSDGRSHYDDSRPYYKNASPYSAAGENLLGEAAQIQRIRAHFAQFLVVDGVTYKKAQEPVYVINTYGLGGNHGGTSLFVEEYYPGRRNWYFTLDERAEAIQTATRIALERGDTKSVPIDRNIHNDCTVLIPEAIRLKPNAAKVLKAMAPIFNSKFSRAA